MDPPWANATSALSRFAQFKNNSQKINESGHPGRWSILLTFKKLMN
jgi:hypothetical protein